MCVVGSIRYIGIQTDVTRCNDCGRLSWQWKEAVRHLGMFHTTLELPWQDSIIRMQWQGLQRNRWNINLRSEAKARRCKQKHIPWHVPRVLLPQRVTVYFNSFVRLKHSSSVQREVQIGPPTPRFSRLHVIRNTRPSLPYTKVFPGRYFTGQTQYFFLHKEPPNFQTDAVRYHFPY